MLHNVGIIYNAVYGTQIMTDCGNKQIVLGSTWSSYPPSFIQNNIFSEETLISYLTKHTYHISLLLFILSIFTTQRYLQSDLFHGFIFFPILCLFIIHFQCLPQGFNSDTVWVHSLWKLSQILYESVTDSLTGRHRFFTVLVCPLEEQWKW